MALEIIVTDAGRAALVNAEGTGTDPVLITEVGISATAIVATTATAALPDEIKRIDTLSGDVVADDTIHLIVRDESSDVFTVRSFALYLEDGTLFGSYGQAAPILEKSAAALMLLALDVRFADIDAALLEFGDTNFLNPPATETVQGVVELATEAEAIAGADAVRAVTPARMLAAVTSWLNARVGAGAPTAYIKTLLLAIDAAAARLVLGLGSIATQAANAVNITGGSIAGINDLAVADGGTGASTAAAARTNLGCGTMAPQNASAVAITGGTASGITALSGTGLWDNGGTIRATGIATPTSGAGIALRYGSVANFGDVVAYDYTAGAYKGVRLNGSSIRVDVAGVQVAEFTAGGLTLVTDLPITEGGTGASTAAAARTNLGCGTMAPQNADAVAITGGSATGLSALSATHDATIGSNDASAGRLTLTGFQPGLIIKDSNTNNANANQVVAYISFRSSDDVQLARLELQDDAGPLYFSCSRGISISSTFSITSIATTANAANMNVDTTTGQVRRSTSSEFFKRDLEAVDQSYADAILQLEPIWYRANPETCPGDNPDWSHWGFSAEQAAPINSRLVEWGYLPTDYEMTIVSRVEPYQVLDDAGEPVLDEAGQPMMATRTIEHEEPRLREGAELKPVGFYYAQLPVLHHVHIRQHRQRLDTAEQEIAELRALVTALQARLDAAP